MPSIPIIMPQLGESIAEAKVVNFLVKPGDTVEADQDLVEVETNKATMTVTSPCRGRIEKLTAELGESYAVGAKLGQIEATQEELVRLGLDDSPPAKTGETDRISNSEAGGGKYRVQPTVRGLPVPANVAGASYLSPRLKARMHELGLSAADLAGVAGSGAAGRVTVEDFEKFIAHIEKQKVSQASSMRVSVADAMRRSWTRPIAHVGMPVCLDPLFAYRKIARPKPGPGL
ncbi:MAG TPA: biotin/lipoyl-containing protein, partial [Verrucomicrobiae bacterium]